MVTVNYIIDCINSNDLNMSEELQIFEVLFKKYGFKTISEYAKENKLTYQGVEYQIKKGLVQNIEVNGKVFVF